MHEYIPFCLGLCKKSESIYCLYVDALAEQTQSESEICGFAGFPQPIGGTISVRQELGGVPRDPKIPEVSTLQETMLDFITASIPSIIPLSNFKELIHSSLASLSEKKTSVQISLSEVSMPFRLDLTKTITGHKRSKDTENNTETEKVCATCARERYLLRGLGESCPRA